MGSKPSGKQYVSKGERPTVNKKTRNAIRSEYLQSPDRWLNQQKALMQGKDIVLTMPNPDRNNTRARFIKVKVSGKEYIKSLQNRGRVEIADEAV